MSYDNLRKTSISFNILYNNRIMNVLSVKFYK